MLQQLKVYEGNTLAFEVIDNLDEKDVKYAHKLYEEKRKKGADKINVLIKLDEKKATKIGIKDFYDNFAWALRNYKNLGRIAIIGDSKLLKTLISADNLFYKNLEKGREEKYFELNQIDEAYQFVQEPVLK